MLILSISGQINAHCGNLLRPGGLCNAVMPGERYIAASSHSIMDNVAPENFWAMIETVHEYGRYR